MEIKRKEEFSKWRWHARHVLISPFRRMTIAGPVKKDSFLPPSPRCRLLAFAFELFQRNGRWSMDPAPPPLLAEPSWIRTTRFLPHSHANDEAARRSMRANHGPRDAPPAPDVVLCICICIYIYTYTSAGMMSLSININHDNLNEVPTGEGSLLSILGSTWPAEGG